MAECRDPNGCCLIEPLFFGRSTGVKFWTDCRWADRVGANVVQRVQPQEDYQAPEIVEAFGEAFDYVETKTEEIGEVIEEGIETGKAKISKVVEDPFKIDSPFLKMSGMMSMSLWLFLLGKGLKAFSTLAQDEE
tara:strand:+ start:1632 stop:2033 length:402 start_codon:yes stop_codon:yes gene_type:complete